MRKQQAICPGVGTNPLAFVQYGSLYGRCGHCRRWIIYYEERDVLAWHVAAPVEKPSPIITWHIGELDKAWQEQQ